MPWQIKKNGNHYNVVKESDGEIMGHKLSKQRAEAMLKALYANVHNEEEPIANKYPLYGYMLCPNCGSRIPRLSKICPICGYHIVASQRNGEPLDNECRLIENFWSDAARAAAKQARSKRLASMRASQGFVSPAARVPIAKPAARPVARPIAIPKSMQRPMPKQTKQTIRQKIGSRIHKALAKVKNRISAKSVTRPVARNPVARPVPPIPRAIPVARPVAAPTKASLPKGTFIARRKAKTTPAKTSPIAKEKATPVKPISANPRQRPSAVEKQIKVKPISASAKKQTQQRLQKSKQAQKQRDRELVRIGKEKAKQENIAKAARLKKANDARNKRLAAFRASRKGKVVKNNCEPIRNASIMSRSTFVQKMLGEQTKSCPNCGMEMTGRKLFCPACRKPGGAKKAALSMNKWTAVARAKARAARKIAKRMSSIERKQEAARLKSHRRAGINKKELETEHQRTIKETLAKSSKRLRSIYDKD